MSTSPTPRTATFVLANAMDILARDIQSGDGVANSAIAEAASRLRELDDAEKRLERECAAKDAQIVSLGLLYEQKAKEADAMRDALEAAAEYFEDRVSGAPDESVAQKAINYLARDCRTALAATPESAASELQRLRDHAESIEAKWIQADTERATLRKERDELAAWKQSALTLQSWWAEIDKFVRTHPQAPLGRDVSAIALQWLKQRDALLAARV